MWYVVLINVIMTGGRVMLLLHLVGFSILLYLHWWCTVKRKSKIKKLKNIKLKCF